MHKMSEQLFDKKAAVEGEWMWTNGVSFSQRLLLLPSMNNSTDQSISPTHPQTWSYCQAVIIDKHSNSNYEGMICVLVRRTSAILLHRPLLTFDLARIFFHPRPTSPSERSTRPSARLLSLLRRRISVTEQSLPKRRSARRTSKSPRDRLPSPVRIRRLTERTSLR
jgi:hypothetical protein